MMFSAIFRPLIVVIISVAAAFALAAGLILFSGINPIPAYTALFKGAFWGIDNFSETIVKLCPLLLTGLAVAFPLKCKIFNIGAEGQLYMGALVSTWLSLFLSLPHIPLLFVLGLGGFLAGGAWGAIAGWLKARWGVSEIINTIMMNYIAIFFVTYIIRGPIQETRRVFPQTDPIPQIAHLDLLFPASRLHIGIVIALFCAIIVYFIFWKTPFGFHIRVVGENPEAAWYAGINIPHHIIISMFIGGGLAGLAGMIEINGIHHRLLASFSPGYGYSAIAVALLGRAHPLGIIFTAFFFGGLSQGAGSMQRAANVPVTVVYLLEGLVILFVLSAEYFLVRRVRIPIREES
jgi:general nucleoside transport system permease protein